LSSVGGKNAKRIDGKIYTNIKSYYNFNGIYNIKCLVSIYKMIHIV